MFQIILKMVLFKSFTLDGVTLVTMLRKRSVKTSSQTIREMSTSVTLQHNVLSGQSQSWPLARLNAFSWFSTWYKLSQNFMTTSSLKLLVRSSVVFKKCTALMTSKSSNQKKELNFCSSKLQILLMKKGVPGKFSLPLASGVFLAHISLLFWKKMRGKFQVPCQIWIQRYHLQPRRST